MSLIAILVIFAVIFGFAYLNHRFAPEGMVKLIVYIVLAIIMLAFLADLAGLTNLAGARV